MEIYRSKREEEPNLEDFYDFFKERIRPKYHEHIVYFLEDVIRNSFLIQEQEARAITSSHAL